MVRLCAFAEIEAQRFNRLSDLEPVASLQGPDRPPTPFEESLSRLLFQFLRPLPGRRMSTDAGEGVSVPLRLESPEKRGFPRFSPETAMEGVELVLVGVYSSKEDGFQASLYLIEKGSGEARRVGSARSSILHLEDFPAALGSSVFSALSGRKLLTMDLETRPKGASISAKDPKAAEISGSRVFLKADSPSEVEISSPGYLAKVLKASDFGSGEYSRRTVELLIDTTNPKASVPDILRQAGKSVAWESKDDYDKAAGRFQAALGRLLASIPFGALSLGAFFLSYEAFTRTGSPNAGLYGSAALAGASLAAAAVFAVDLGIKMSVKIQAAR